MPPTISKKHHSASPQSAPSVITQQGNPGCILKKPRGKKKSVVRDKSSSVCRRTVTLKSRRGNILIFLSVVVTTGVRTRVTALILAKNPMGSDLGCDLSCNNTTVRHAFCVRQNTGKILMPTPSLIPRLW